METFSAAGFTSAAAMYLGATVGAGSSGGNIDCDNIFVMIGARRGEFQVSSTSGKFNFGLGTIEGITRSLLPYKYGNLHFI